MGSRREVRGEGIFIRLHEDAVEAWLVTTSVQERGRAFLEAHRRWRAARHLDPPDAGFAGMRYVLLHTLSHALPRQLALESGYAMAGLRERIYALHPTDDDGPMAGILLYWTTTCPDVTPQSVAFALQLAIRAAEGERQVQSVELVWTGPSPDATPLRRTDQAMLQLDQRRNRPPDNRDFRAVAHTADCGSADRGGPAGRIHPPGRRVR